MAFVHKVSYIIVKEYCTDVLKNLRIILQIQPPYKMTVFAHSYLSFVQNSCEVLITFLKSERRSTAVCGMMM